MIVIATHRSGLAFLDNLLESFNGYDEYPILIVISAYQPADDVIFQEIKRKFSNLPLTWEHIDTNSFEFGALYTAWQKTSYDEMLLLSHSCEIVNTALFDLVFEQHRGHSVAFGLQSGNWRNAQGENEALTLKYLDPQLNRRLLEMGDITFWQAHIGKYRRVILDQMSLLEYLPRNMIEAISKSELLFTSSYHAADKNTVVLFPDWQDGSVFAEKFGKRRLKITNEYLTKWKTHWNSDMVFAELGSPPSGHLVKRFLREQCPRIYARLKRAKKTL